MTKSRHQRVTLADVAREAGVSPMTVSRVINDTGRISDMTRANVREVIERLDYRPSRAARTLVTNQTLIVGIVVPDITNPYFAEILQGAENVMWEHDYSVLLANTDETPSREEAVLSQLEDSTIDGLIICSSRLPDQKLLSLIKPHQAVVSVNRQLPQPIGSVVSNRDMPPGRQRAKRAAQHLIRSGRRRIGYLCLKRSMIAARIDEFLQELATHGLEARPEQCEICPPTWQGGYMAGKKLLAENPDLDGLVGGNDLVALGVMRAAIEAGWHIPDDLAIVGGDDILMASQVAPALTTFRVPKYKMGTMAAKLLLKHMEGDTKNYEYLYEEELIVRESAP